MKKIKKVMRRVYLSEQNQRCDFRVCEVVMEIVM